MKVLLAAHGYPPELVGGTEQSVQVLAQGLVAAGHEVVVVAGSMQFEDGFRVSRDVDNDVRVVRIHRADLYFDHWQKSHAHDASAAFRDVLRDERPDVVHVHHWIRLSDDLVLTAAREGIPACVTLHDLWTSCLVTFRVRPDSHEFCEAPLAPSPCLDCAKLVPPRTPWVDALAERTLLAERRTALVRELTLARIVIAPTLAHARALGTYLGIDENAVSLRVVPHGRDLAPADLGAEDRRPRGDARPLVLGSWGHLHPLKGADLLVEAVRLAGPGVELRLAGGEVLPAFAETVRAAAQDLPVTIDGPFTQAELGNHRVTDVHAFVSGSRAHESWGLVVDEARALGLPMILPRAGAFPERLAEGEGALFYERGNAADLARVLVELRDNPARLVDVRAAAPPLEALVPTSSTHVAALESLYAEVIAAGAPEVPPEEWFESGLASRRRAAWDADLTRRTAQELGLE